MRHHESFRVAMLETGLYSTNKIPELTTTVSLEVLVTSHGLVGLTLGQLLVACVR